MGAVVPIMEDFESPAPGGYFTNGLGYTVNNTSNVLEGTISREFGITGFHADNITRRNITIDWDLDVDVYMGCYIYLDPLFYSRNTVQCRLFGATDFDGATQHVRVGLWINTDDRAYVFRHTENTSPSGQVILLSLGLQWIPAGVWTHVEVRYKLSQTPGVAVTTAWKNGVQAATNTTDHKDRKSVV